MEKEVPSCPALREARKKTINKLAHQNLYAKKTDEKDYRTSKYQTKLPVRANPPC